MESVVRPILSEKYEVARKIMTNLLQNGLVSQLEFDEIDKENLKSFV